MDDMMNLLLQEANSSVYIRTINKNIFDKYLEENA